LFDSKETAVATTFLGPLNKRNPSGFLPSLTPKTYNLNTDLSQRDKSVFAELNRHRSTAISGHLMVQYE
ncbi:MAG: hypothetical protein IJI26_07795, partial [Clostridia bacterium]|nr:hypothetical protein [Clostridia bacterium]